jgi:hypothetical protein
MVRAELARQVALLRAPAIHSAVGCAVTPSHKIWRRPAPLYQAISTLILEQVDDAIKGVPVRRSDGPYHEVHPANLRQ